MSLPDEKMRALLTAHTFLINLLNPQDTPRVPKAIRERACRVLRHYPYDYEIREFYGDKDVKKHNTNLGLPRAHGGPVDFCGRMSAQVQVARESNSSSDRHDPSHTPTSDNKNNRKKQLVSHIKYIGNWAKRFCLGEW